VKCGASHEGGRSIRVHQGGQGPRDFATCKQLQNRRPLTVIHRSDGPTAPLGLRGFMVGAQIDIDGAWWLAVETTAAEVGREGCGTRAIGHGRQR
jgi:hypothetical protein